MRFAIVAVLAALLIQESLTFSLYHPQSLNDGTDKFKGHRSTLDERNIGYEADVVDRELNKFDKRNLNDIINQLSETMRQLMQAQIEAERLIQQSKASKQIAQKG